MKRRNCTGLEFFGSSGSSFSSASVEAQHNDKEGEKYPHQEMRVWLGQFRSCLGILHAAEFGLPRPLCSVASGIFVLRCLEGFSEYAILQRRGQGTDQFSYHEMSIYLLILLVQYCELPWWSPDPRLVSPLFEQYSELPLRSPSCGRVQQIL